jgi:hypothetical protein
MMDWPLMDGGTVRLESIVVYCANCGDPQMYMPKENCAFAFYLCNECFRTYGAIAGTYAQPDDEFCRAVAAEMEKRFGRHLNDTELCLVAERGELGATLDNLARESPYPSHDHRPRNQ